MNDGHGQCDESSFELWGEPSNFVTTLPGNADNQNVGDIMRKILLIAPVLLLAGAASAQTPQWAYGAGNGDGVQYQGPKPTYNYAYGPGNGDGVQSGTTAQMGYAYGGENQKGGMMQMTTPQPKQQTASPKPSSTARPGNRS